MKLLDLIMKYLGWSKSCDVSPPDLVRVVITPFRRSVHFMQNKFMQSSVIYKPRYWKKDGSRQSIRESLAIAQWERERKVNATN